MSPTKAAVTTCEIYDQALKYSRDFRVPPGVAQPGYTSTWLEENIATLERYVAWLNGGGTSWQVTRTYHIPIAGHILSLNHKPSGQLDLDHDLTIAMTYILAKQHGACWNKICRNSLAKFRRFLLHERGLVESKIKPYDAALHTEGLPAWLVEQLIRYQHVKQRNWREARIEEGVRRFWSSHLRVWRFLVERYGVHELSEVKRIYFSDYIDHRLSMGASVRSVNGDLRAFHGLMDFLQAQGLPVPHALLRLRCLKEPDPLPRYLTDAQVRALRDDLEQRGKGQVDRTVYLTPSVVSALREYLAVRGPAITDHVFLYRNQALSKDLIHGRLKACGERVGVAVFAHKLRHTCATQLLNAGCPITSIQKFLGHKRLATTLTYARAHDQTVADDYFSAMKRVEQRLDLFVQPEEKDEPVSEDERGQILALTEKLVEPELSAEARLVIAAQIQLVLLGGMKAFPSQRHTLESNRSLPPGHPPPENMHPVTV